jgi:hypothetical protein
MLIQTARQDTTRTHKTRGICLLGLAFALFAAPAFSQVGHIHELYYNESNWADKDLTALMIFAGVEFEAVYYLFWVLNDANGL